MEPKNRPLSEDELSEAESEFLRELEELIGEDDDEFEDEEDEEDFEDD